MTTIVSTAAMRRIDTQAINGDLQRGFSYMRCAASAIVDAISALEIDKKRQHIAIVCGKGNNGGDGFLAGAMLAEAGYLLSCYAVCDGEELEGEARLAFEEAQKQKIITRIDCDSTAPLSFARYAVIIDALLGTGISGNPRGIYATLIRSINDSESYVIAVDTPSGLDNDSGRCGVPCVHADATIAMGFAKIGQLFYPGRAAVGVLNVADLNYPEEIVAANDEGLFNPDILQMPPRHPAGSKFDHGSALLLCGSRGMLGSVSLAAEAALRSGCGIVHCAISASSLDSLATKLCEPVLHPIEETESGSPAPAAAAELQKLASSMQALLIGCGLSHHPDTCSLVRELLSKLQNDVVLDADGLNAFKGHAEKLQTHHGKLIITPHAGEWERLFGAADEEPLSRVAQLSYKAQKYQMEIVYKGSPTIVACSDGRCAIMPVGNSGMATAGSGDVLAGIIVSLLAQGCNARDAAVLGVGLHGRAGDAAASASNEYALIASDMVAQIGAAISSL